MRTVVLSLCCPDRRRSSNYYTFILDSRCLKEASLFERDYLLKRYPKSFQVGVRRKTALGKIIECIGSSQATRTGGKKKARGLVS